MCDHPKSTFILSNGPYKYTVMYLGWTKASTYYMDLMNKEFMEYLDKFIVVFINDVLVYSKDEEEPEEHFRPAWQKLGDHRLYAKLSKCKSWMKQESSLSHFIMKVGMSIDSSKIQDTLT
jgi:hypothetical protein